MKARLLALSIALLLLFATCVGLRISGVTCGYYLHVDVLDRSVLRSAASLGVACFLNPTH